MFGRYQTIQGMLVYVLTCAVLAPGVMMDLPGSPDESWPGLALASEADLLLLLQELVFYGHTHYAELNQGGRTPYDFPPKVKCEDGYILEPKSSQCVPIPDPDSDYDDDYDTYFNDTGNMS